jgi:ABC-2 type transport system permease protein
MFAKIAAFEFRYQLRQPLFWVVFILFFLLTFGSVTIDQIQIGSGGNVHKNAPFALAQTHLILSLFYMFVTAAFVANLVVRDDETGFGPIIRSTSVSKSHYLLGRFSGGFAAAALAYLSVPLAFFIGSLMPWVDAEILGPNRWVDYGFAYGILALPALFLTSAVFFSVATVTRSMMATYVAVVAFFVVYLTANILLDKPQFEQGMALFEPFGLAAYGLVTKYWTATERNLLNPALSGILLWNRLFSLGLSAGFLALAYSVFRFEAPAARHPKGGSIEKAMTAPPSPPNAPLPFPKFDAHAAWTLLGVRIRLELQQVFLSPAYLVLLALGVVNAGAALWYANEIYGGTIFPVTRVMISTLEGAFGIIPIIVAIYYAGELVWRERDRRVHEIMDATPIPDWALFVPKTLAIGLVLLSTLLIGVLTAIVLQAVKGYFNFEVGKYLLWLVLPDTISFFLIAVLAVFLQTLSPQKFVGWGLMVLYLISRQVMASLGWEHLLYRYGAAPFVPLSDMNGPGQFWIANAWLRLYWTAFALALCVLCHVLWRRGVDTNLMPRLRRLGHRLKGVPGILLAMALSVFVTTGTYIFVNTNIWNSYRTHLDDERWQADYEKTLLGFEKLPQPHIYDVRLDVDIRPHDRKLVTQGVYRFENRTRSPLREMHVQFNKDLRIDALAIEGARPKKTYDAFNYRIFSFDTPLQPGEQRSLSFTTTLERKGFKNSGMDTNLVDNGTFVHDTDIAPGFGVSRAPLLQDRSKRRKYGLAPELRMAKLGDVASRAYHYLRHDSDWVQADITVTTDADQIPIAPGYRVFETVSQGRRTARFKTEAPILQFFSIQSARYQVRSETYKGIDLSIYYDAQHPWNIDRMMRAMKLSLDYYQTQFGPYQFRQARILEFPDYAQFAQSFANTIPYSEGLGFIANFKDPEKIDLVTYVTAHELAHQWWAHQIIGADQQGSTVLSETLAQYSALMVMERLYGPEKIRKFLKYELDNYLRSRGSEVIEELPLIRVEDQAYIHYRKGSVVMYRLKDEIGEAAINRALRALLAKYAFKAAPYPTALDLVAALRAEAPVDKQGLITDLFEKITLYDVKTTKAVAKKRSDGRYDITLTVDAKKLIADGQGKETEVPMAERVDLGLFSVRPDAKTFDRSKVLAFKPIQLHSGVQTLVVTTPTRPNFAGIDPYTKLIDRNADDNLVSVSQ